MFEMKESSFNIIIIIKSILKMIYLSHSYQCFYFNKNNTNGVLYFTLFHSLSNSSLSVASVALLNRSALANFHNLIFSTQSLTISSLHLLDYPIRLADEIGQNHDIFHIHLMLISWFVLKVASHHRTESASGQPRNLRNSH